MSGNPPRAIKDEQFADSNRQSSAIFIDRDGTLNEDIGYVSSPEQLVLYPWAGEAVRLINEAELKAIVITNQSGIARGMYTEETLDAIHQKMIEELATQGAKLDGVYYCPHHPEIGAERNMIECDCRKPKTGMLDRAAREHNIDLSRSFVIGDKASDINLALNAGAHAALVLTGYGRETETHRDLFPCEPAFVAETLLDAVRLILDTRDLRR